MAILWLPGHAIIAEVAPGDVPHVRLPPDAIALKVNDLASYHVTLVSRSSLEPHAARMPDLWPRVQAVLPAPPRPILLPEVALAVDPLGQRRTWFLKVENQESFRQLVDRLVAELDAVLQPGGFTLAEPPRFFHVSVANDQGGDPTASIGGIGELDWLNGRQ